MIKFEDFARVKTIIIPLSLLIWGFFHSSAHNATAIWYKRKYIQIWLALGQLPLLSQSYCIRWDPTKWFSNQIKQVIQELWILLLGHVEVYKDMKVQSYTFFMNSNEFWALSHFNLAILCCAGWHGFLCPRVIDFNATEQHGAFYDIVYQCGCQALLNWVCGWGKEERYSVFMCVWYINFQGCIRVWTGPDEPSIHQRERDINRNGGETECAKYFTAPTDKPFKH